LILMKTSIFAFVFFIFAGSFSAFASTHKVRVQCAIPGPVYEGELQTEMEIKNWEPAGECVKYGTYSTMKLKIPNFSLKFNNLEYAVTSSYTEGHFKSPSCEIDKATGFGDGNGIRLTETKSNYEGYIPEMTNARDGQFSRFFRVDSFVDTSSCTIRVLD
jgi:hypothetical protein